MSKKKDKKDIGFWDSEYWPWWKGFGKEFEDWGKDYLRMGPSSHPYMGVGLRSGQKEPYMFSDTPYFGNVHSDSGQKPNILPLKRAGKSYLESSFPQRKLEKLKKDAEGVFGKAGSIVIASAVYGLARGELEGKIRLGKGSKYGSLRLLAPIRDSFAKHVVTQYQSPSTKGGLNFSLVQAGKGDPVGAVSFPLGTGSLNISAPLKKGAEKQWNINYSWSLLPKSKPESLDQLRLIKEKYDLEEDLEARPFGLDPESLKWENILDKKKEKIDHGVLRPVTPPIEEKK